MAHDSRQPSGHLPDDLASPGSFQILVPARPGSDHHLDNSVPSRFVRIAFEALPASTQSSVVENSHVERDNNLPPTTANGDKALLTPSAVRFLLSRYDRNIKPQYDVAVPELLNQDGASFRKLPDSPKFKILMACAIAAARESYMVPDWKPLAQVCRNWANELVTPLISAGDSDTLAAILLLLVYELSDSSRGIAWELLDLAARTCLQLGWHQAPLAHNGAEGQEKDSTVGSYDPDEVRLMSVLKEIEGSAHPVSCGNRSDSCRSLQTIFNRPSMLSGLKLPTTSETENMHDIYTQISDQLYGKGRVYENQGCPFVGEVATLMDILDTIQTQHPVAKETWLSFLPVCFRHKQCISCFQEADEDNAKGMRTLRQKIISAASGLISSIHHSAASEQGFLPPVFASSKALIAGCSIATAISKKWTPAQHHAKDMIKCTETLALYAPHWHGGNEYLSVWRDLIDLLDLGK